jgi:hypothetical protein
MKTLLMRNPRMDKLTERLSESKEFWALVSGYAALVLADSETNYPGEKVLSRDEFLADLTAEIEHADLCISDEENEWESA